MGANEMERPIKGVTGGDLPPQNKREKFKKSPPMVSTDGPESPCERPYFDLYGLKRPNPEF